MGLFTDFQFFASFHLSRGLKLGGRTNLAFHTFPSSRCSVWSWIWHHSATTVFGRSSLFLLLDASWALRAAWACRICRQIMENRLKKTQVFKNDGWKTYFPSRIVPCQLSLVHYQGVYPFISAKFEALRQQIWGYEPWTDLVCSDQPLGFSGIRLLTMAPYLGDPLRFWPIDRLQDMWINIYIYIRYICTYTYQTSLENHDVDFVLLPFVIFQSIMFCLKDSNDIWMNVLCNHDWCMTHSMGTQNDVKLEGISKLSW